MNLDNILFIDTESNPNTKQPECITWLLGNEKGIIEIFDHDSYLKMCSLWDRCDAILMYNAPYDIGALSIFYPENHYEWKIKNINNEKSASWNIRIFEHNYDVRRIAFSRNMIKCLNVGKQISHKKGKKSTPIIDLLKLWNILVTDEPMSLKKLIETELGKKSISYSHETSKTDEYRYQDVICLKELTEKFFEKIKHINEVKEFSIADWSYIKTPATFTKILYKKRYPDLKEYQKNNNEIIDRFNLKQAFEDSYHGGITLAMHRGKIERTSWVDIEGAYSKAIEVLNTDSYLEFDIQKGTKLQFEKPQLLRIKTNFLMKSVNKSLKLFGVVDEYETWIWNFDIIACQNLYRDYRYEVLEIFDIIPKLKIDKSLCTEWIKEKNTEKKTNGKTTLYNFYKFLSNTSYGIKAQRKPFVTEHTNLVIAGMITAKVHQILTTIIKYYEDNNYRNLYNDTDSVCAQVDKNYDEQKAVKEINSIIFPFTVDGEGIYDETTILSLKRYVSILSLEKYKEKGIDKKDKVKLHGKSRYKISFKDISDYVFSQKIVKDEYLKLSQMSANTEISMKQILNIYPFLEKYKHPFMFVKDVKTDVLLSEFMEKWFLHVDTKTTFETSGEFKRTFHVFQNIRKAEEFFKNLKSENDEDDITCSSFRNWDDEVKTDFKQYEHEYTN